MMKIIKWGFTLTMTLLMLACQPTKKEEKTAGNDYSLTDTVVSVVENPKLTEFKQFVTNADTANFGEVSAIAAKFKQIFTGQSAGLCDTAFVSFQTFLDKAERHLNDSLQRDTTDYASLLESGRMPPRLKTFNIKLKNNGFRFRNYMGQVYVAQDRGYIVSNLYSLFTDTMKMYLNEIKLENEQGFAIDDQIAIHPAQLVDRIVWYERFIASHPGFGYAGNCKDYRKAYLTYLVNGYQNTKVTDGNTRELTPFYVEAYNHLMKKYASSETAVLLRPYINAIRQKQTDQAKSLRKTMIVKGYIYDL